MTSLFISTAVSTSLAQGDPRPEFRVGLEGISGAIDPGADHSNVGAQNWIALFDSLIQRDHTSVEAVLEPALATNWEYVDEEETVLELKKTRQASSRPACNPC